MVAAKTSFQESTKAKIAAAASPGKAIGNTILVKACIRWQPRVRAASSNSLGTATKMLLVTKMVWGKARAVCTIATANRVSYRPKFKNVTARGIDKITIGKALVVRIIIL